MFVVMIALNYVISPRYWFYPLCFQSISCHYAASDCEYIDVKGTTQELIANEVHDIIAKKLGKDVAEHIDFRVITC